MGKIPQGAGRESGILPRATGPQAERMNAAEKRGTHNAHIFHFFQRTPCASMSPS
jgi:hypothetical protein